MTSWSSSRLASGREREGAHAVESLERVLGGDLRVARDERLVGDAGDDELEAEAFGILEAEPVSLEGRRDPLGPEA